MCYHERTIVSRQTFKIRWVTCAFAVAALIVLPFGTIRAAALQDTPAIVTLTSDGRILFRGESIPLDRLDATIRAAGIPPRLLTLRSEGTVPYSTVIRVLDALSMHHPSARDLPGPGYREQLQRFSQ